MAVALTTTFTPSAYCTTDYYYFNASCSYDGTTTVDPYSCAFFHAGPDTSTSDCMPSGWNASTTSYYSPGVCPYGYEEACKSAVVDAMGDVQTQALCCPSGYGCQTGYVYPWFSTDVCSSHMASSATLVYTESIEGKGYVTITTVDQQGFNAFGVFIEYAATTSSSGGASSTAAATTSAPTAATTPTSTSTPSGSKGLSSGAKAGIGVGVGVGVPIVIAIVALFFLCARRRRKADAAAAAAAGAAGAGSGPGGYAPVATSSSSPGPAAAVPPSTTTATSTTYLPGSPGSPGPPGYVSSTGTPVPADLAAQVKGVDQKSSYTYELPSVQQQVIAELPATHAGAAELPASNP